MAAPLSSAMRRFNQLLGETDRVYHEAAVRLGVSDSEMNVLYALCGGEGRCPLRDICHQYGVSKQTVNSAVRKLEGAGMIYLESSGPRSKDVCLTEAGWVLARRTAVPLMELESEIFAAWTPAEVEQYLRLTQRYLDAFQERLDRFQKQKGPAKRAGPGG